MQWTLIEFIKDIKEIALPTKNSMLWGILLEKVKNNGVAFIPPQVLKNLFGVRLSDSIRQ